MTAMILAEAHTWPEVFDQDISPLLFLVVMFAGLYFLMR